jgi:preprotein translocase subunit SecD
MTRNIYRYLIAIVILLVIVAWVDWPNNSGNLPFNGHINTTTRLGLDLSGGLRVLLEADVPAGTTVSQQSLQDTMSILENRVNGLGLSDVTFQLVGSNRILAEFPGITNTDQVILLLKETGQLAFVPMGTNRLPEGTQIQVDYSAVGNPATVLTPSTTGSPSPAGTASSTETLSSQTGTPASATATSSSTQTTPAQASPTTGSTTTPGATPTSGPSATPGPTATPTPVVYKAIMTGSDLIESSIAVSKDSLGNYQINFALNPDGTKIFGDFTSAHVNEYLAIVLDGTIISDPQIQNPITSGSGVIQGSFTYDTGNNLAIQLRYGSLPVPMKVAQSEAVGATLGQDSIRKSEIAGIIGLSLVVLFMALYYRLPGVLADVALILYALTNFAFFKLMPVTLTLPGIAGFVLSLGVAVDANILIFERLKEELRSGRTLRQAIDLAWQRAWPSIRDSNISTLITCGILLIFGSAFGASLVKGFAINLALGVLISLFTAIIVTRTFLHVVLDNLKNTEHPRWFGA